MKIANPAAALLMFVSIMCSCSLPGRKGVDIYNNFFGKPLTNCVQVINSRDARALDDCCVWLYFTTCPAEVKRILAQVPYVSHKMDKQAIAHEYPEPSSIDESLISSDPPKWWSLKLLGDSCIKYEYQAKDKDYIQIAYVSANNTKVFYHDIIW